MGLSSFWTVITTVFIQTIYCADIDRGALKNVVIQVINNKTLKSPNLSDTKYNAAIQEVLQDVLQDLSAMNVINISKPNKDGNMPIGVLLLDKAEKIPEQSADVIPISVTFDGTNTRRSNLPMLLELLTKPLSKLRGHGKLKNRVAKLHKKNRQEKLLADRDDENEWLVIKTGINSPLWSGSRVVNPLLKKEEKWTKSSPLILPLKGKLTSLLKEADDDTEDFVSLPEADDESVEDSEKLRFLNDIPLALQKAIKFGKKVRGAKKRPLVLYDQDRIFKAHGHQDRIFKGKKSHPGRQASLNEKVFLALQGNNPVRIPLDINDNVFLALQGNNPISIPLDIKENVLPHFLALQGSTPEFDASDEAISNPQYPDLMDLDTISIGKPLRSGLPIITKSKKGNSVDDEAEQNLEYDIKLAKMIKEKIMKSKIDYKNKQKH